MYDQLQEVIPNIIIQMNYVYENLMAMHDAAVETQSVAKSINMFNCKTFCCKIIVLCT